jgi:hypothetical protein
MNPENVGDALTTLTFLTTAFVKFEGKFVPDPN